MSLAEIAAALAFVIAGTVLGLVGIVFGWIGLARKHRGLLTTAVVLLFTGGATILGWAVVDGRGADAAAVGLAAALVPAPILVGAILWLGRYRRRPWIVLGFVFGWGAFVATAIALGVNTGASVLLEHYGLDSDLAAIVSAPIVEEGAKLLGPLLVYWTARRHLTGTLDAIVYCGLSGAGFALAENVLYASGTYLTGTESLDAAAGLANVALLVVVRGIGTMFAHPLFTGIAAIGIGKAARRPRRQAGAQTARLSPGPLRSASWIIGMLLCGMGLHAIWNGASVLGAYIDMPYLWYALYPAFLAPLFFTMVGAALWLRAADARRTQVSLAPLVSAAQLSPPELASLASFSRRASARAWARRWAGKPGEAAMRDFQRAASDVAEQYDLASIGRPWDGRVVHEGVRRMNAARTAYAGRDPRTPPALWDGRRYHVAFPDGVTRPVEPPAQPVMPLPLAPPPPPPAYPVTYA